MESSKGKAKIKNEQWYRRSVQLIFLILVAAISLNSYLENLGTAIPILSTASLHAICPYGGVVSIYRFVTAGTFVQKIHESSFVLMSIAFFLALLFGPVICGWVCPFGTVQELVSRLGKKMFKKRFNHFIPAAVDTKLRYIRYIVLFMVIYKTATTAKLMFQDIDPYYALFNFWADDVSVKALAILIIILAASLFVERPWCKYACPYGALLGLFNGIRLFKIRRTPATCIDCKACDRSCPMNIPVSGKTAVLNHQCISCMACTSESTCPIPDTVVLSMTGGKSNAN